jgi:hypothetical protein
MSAFPPTLQAFFTDRLVNQRDASPRTVAAYDPLRQRLDFASQSSGQLHLADLDAPRRLPRPPRTRPRRQRRLSAPPASERPQPIGPSADSVIGS